VGASAQTLAPVSVIDLELVYSLQARQAAGGDQAIHSQILGAIMEANQVFQNSQVNARIHMVHAAEVDYAESGLVRTDLVRLSTPHDGQLDQVQQWRDLHNADLVCLVVEQGSDCNFYGWQGPSAANAFSVIRRPFLAGRWFLPVVLGFNFGCQMERSFADSAAAFPYAYGYTFKVGSTRYSTVEGLSGVRLPYFSNPNITLLSPFGATIGVPAGRGGAADNSRVINQTASLVSAFRGTAVATLPPSVHFEVPFGSAIVLPAHSDLPVLVSASDSDGYVSRVDLFKFDPGIQATTLLSSSTNPPWSFLLTNLAEGQWQLIAQAVDDLGAASCSPIVQVSLTNYPPDNDSFEARAVLSGTNLTVRTDNRLASSEPNEPNHAGLSASHSVWWTWTAPVTGKFAVQTVGSSYRTVIAVYQGTVLSNLTALTASAAYPEARVCFLAEEGETYQFALDGYYWASGDTTLWLIQTASPENDDFAGRQMLSGTNVTVIATNTFATREQNEPEHRPDDAPTITTSHRTLWWTWTAPGDGELDLSTAGSSFDTVLAVYTGDSLLGLTPAIKSYPNNHAGNETRLNVAAGTTYQVAVDGAGGDGTLLLSLVFWPRPVNDDFAQRTTLTASHQTVAASSRGATKEASEPLHGGATGGRSVWWSWTAPSAGTLAMNTFGSSFSPYIALYVGTSLATLQPVIANQNPFLFTVTAGTTYQIAVDGWDSRPGDIVFHLDFSPAPLNDNFADRLWLTGQLATATGDISGASKEPGEPGHPGFHDGASVWWSWTAPASGYTTIGAQTEFNLSMGVYTGSDVSNLATVGVFEWAWNVAGAVSFFALEGSNYNFAVNGDYGAGGGITLNLQQAAYPNNDNFANRAVMFGSAWTATNTNVRATSEAGEPGHGGQAAARSLWWSWTATETRDVSLFATGSGFVPRLSVYTGTDLTNLTSQVEGTNGTARFHAVAGIAYQLGLDGTSVALGNVVLELVPAPDNDDFAARTIVQGTNLLLAGSTRAASVQPGEPIRYPGQTGASVWWSWTAAHDGEVGVQVAGGAFTPVIGIYSGSSLTSLSTVFAGFIGGPGTTFFAQGGVTYQIAVDGYGGDIGAYAISLRQGAPPINDQFSGRIAVAGTHPLVSGSTSSATTEAGEPGWYYFQSHHTCWWSWVAPTNGSVTIAYGATNGSATMAVFTGNAVSSLTRITSGDGNGTLTFAAIEGTEYQLALDGVSGGSGPVWWELVFSTIRLTQPLANSVFTEPGPIALQAEATAYDGSTVRMDFFQNNVFLGSMSNAPFTLIWSNVLSGDYTLGAKAVDATGISRAAPPVTIPVLPANDAFADRIVIPGSDAVIHARGMKGTLEGGEPTHGPVSWESFWWTWTAPTSGLATLSKPSATDYRFVLLDVYRGSTLPGLVLVTNTPANLSGTLASSITWEVIPGESYQIAVAGSFFDKADIPVALSFGAAPANDQFANSAILSGENVSFSGTTFNATREAGEPNHAGSSGRQSVWWTWTAPRSASVTLVVSPYGFTPILAAYTSDQLSNLVEVGSAIASGLTFSASAGTVYHFALDGVNGRSGAFSLELLTAPANDDFTNRFLLVGPSVLASANNKLATSESGEVLASGASGKTLWWSWTAPSNATVAINLASASFSSVFDESVLRGPRYVSGPLVSVFTGPGLTNLTRVASNSVHTSYGPFPGPWAVTTNCTFDATSGVTYHVAVDGCNGWGGALGFALAASEQLPPDNDNFASRVVLAGEELTFVGQNRFATRETGEPAVPGAGGNASVWWSWTAPVGGYLTLQVTESDFGDILTAFAGGSLAHLTRLGGDTNSVEFHVRSGDVVQIALDSVGADQGKAVTKLKFRRSPPNDDFANRLQLEGRDVTVRSSNIDATAESSDPAHPASTTRHTVWFTWTAPVSGDVTLALVDGSRGLPFAVYAGSVPSSLLTLAQAPDSDLYYVAHFYAAAGTGYQIAVYDDAGGEGEFGLHLIAPPFPPSLEARGLSRLPDGFHMGIGGASGQSYVLQASTNLVNWDSILVDTMLGNRAEVIDSDSGLFDKRFYRLLPMDALFSQAHLVADPPGRASGGFLVPVKGPAGQPFSLQASTNLVDWVELDRGYLTDRPTEILDADQLPLRFYRAEPLR